MNPVETILQLVALVNDGRDMPILLTPDALRRIVKQYIRDKREMGRKAAESFAKHAIERS